MALRRPDIRDYQQLVEPVTGRFDCGAYAAATVADAHSRGEWKLTGRQVRLATDEPVPDKLSPGLNVRQTDDALVLLTDGEVNLDTQWSAPWSRVEAKLKEGRWGHLCVIRGPLVIAGFAGGNRFRGAHGIAIAFDPDTETPIMGDPLVPFYQDVTWAALREAAGQFAGEAGRAVIAFTRPVGAIPALPAPRYSVRFTRSSFFAYTVNSRLKITGREPKQFSRPTSAPCDAPRIYNWPGNDNRNLVRVTKGVLAGRYVEPGASGLRLEVMK